MIKIKIAYIISHIYKAVGFEWMADKLIRQNSKYILLF